MVSNRKNLIRIICSLSCFVATFVCYLLLEERMPWWGWLVVFLAIYLSIGYDVLWRAARNIIHGKVFDENFLMIIATVGAFVVSEYAEAVAVMLFYQVGEYFQSYAVGKSRKSIAELMDICPQSARLITDDGEKEVFPEDVEVGSLVAVYAGERVPIDGVIHSGSGYIDTSALTGESVPVKVSEGDSVPSGAISTEGVLVVKTQKPYADSTVSKILELVENASAKKAKSESFITRFAQVYTPAVVICALLIAIVPPLCIAYNSQKVWIEYVTRALTFLVVSCPCALVISVPMSFFGGIGGASRHGILVKGGNYLELLARMQTVAFDKTGTITKGVFEVVNVYGEERALELAARAERFSTHPIARSIVSSAEKRYGSFTADDSDRSLVKELSGRGVVLDGERQILCGNAQLMEEYSVDYQKVDCNYTVVYVAENGKYVGAIEIADVIKPESVDAIAELKTQGVKSVMLTGDKLTTAKNVAESVGIDEYYAQLLPSDKVDALEKLMGESVSENGGLNADKSKKKVKRKKRRSPVMGFVGDGINDAPVLSRADIGIAMGGIGSDAAIEAADVVIMNDKLTLLPVAKRIAKKTVGIVKQNIVFALAVKLAVLVLAGVGLANMWLAVFADVGVAVLAILNAMRAMKIKDE